MSDDAPRELWAVDLGTIDYLEALELQRRIVAAKKGGTFEPELLLLLEHPAVITLGRRGDASNVVAAPETLAARGIPVYHVERGGDVTYHGPGQLVGYPIVSLRHLPNRKDVGKFVWNMQEAIIRTLARYGVPAERIDKVIGVWVRRPAPLSLPSRSGRGHARPPRQDGACLPGSQDRGDWRACGGLGLLSRLRAQRQHPARRLQPDSSLRPGRSRRHLDGDRTGAHGGAGTGQAGGGAAVSGTVGV